MFSRASWWVEWKFSLRWKWESTKINNTIFQHLFLCRLCSSFGPWPGPENKIIKNHRKQRRNKNSFRKLSVLSCKEEKWVCKNRWDYKRVQRTRLNSFRFFIVVFFFGRNSNRSDQMMRSRERWWLMLNRMLNRPVHACSKREWIESGGIVMMDEWSCKNEFQLFIFFSPLHIHRLFSRFGIDSFLPFASSTIYLLLRLREDSNYCVCCVFIFLTVVQLFYTYTRHFNIPHSLIFRLHHHSVRSHRGHVKTQLYRSLIDEMCVRWCSSSWNRIARAKEPILRHEKRSILHS